MLKRFFTIVILILLALQVAEGRKKRAKSGKVEGRTYQDAGYGFQITFPDNWKPKLHKADGIVRLTLVQQDFEPDELFNRKGNDMPFMGLACEPLIEFWVIETVAAPKDILDSLLLDKSKSDWRKPLFAAVQPTYSDVTFQGVKGGPYQRAKAGTVKGKLWKGIFEYLHVDWGFNANLGVALTCLSIEDKTSLVILVRAEPEYLDASMDVAFGMQKSLQLQSAERE